MRVISHLVNSIRRRCCVTYGNLSSLQLPSVCARAGRLVASNGGLLKSAKREMQKCFVRRRRLRREIYFQRGNKKLERLLSLAFLQTSSSSRSATRKS